MTEISWNKFKAKHGNPNNAFEGLCYHLFCRRFKLNKPPKADFNQAGLETEPVLVNGEYYGFQAKFFDHTTNLSQIEDSVKTAIDKFKGGLDEIRIYLNTNVKLRSKGCRNTEALAKKAGIKIYSQSITSNFSVHHRVRKAHICRKSTVASRSVGNSHTHRICHTNYYIGSFTADIV